MKRAMLLLVTMACGGTISSNGDGGGSEAGVTCPSDVSTLVGAACTDEGKTCGGDKCTNACSFCNIVRCSSGVWTQQEAFPDPNCADTSTTCSYPPANNDPQCPSAYSYSYYQQPCSPVGLSCAYPGAGDEVNGCFATAMMWCYGDAGTGTWTVAQ